MHLCNRDPWYQEICPPSCWLSATAFTYSHPQLRHCILSSHDPRVAAISCACGQIERQANYVSLTSKIAPSCRTKPPVPCTQERQQKSEGSAGAHGNNIKTRSVKAANHGKRGARSALHRAANARAASPATQLKKHLLNKKRA